MFAKKNKFSFWRPSWISQLAINYANLCRQFQKLQTMLNILVYDRSCSTGGSGLPLEIVAFLAHSHPTMRGLNANEKRQDVFHYVRQKK